MSYFRKLPKGERRRVAATGGHAKAEKARAAKAPLPPYAGTFLEFLNAVGRGGPSRAAWTTFWKVTDGLPLLPDEISTFRLHTGRTTPPTTPAREVVVLAGRRSGKSENMTARATWRAISKEWTAMLSVGERCVIPIVAADKEQARNTLAYLKGLAEHPLVAHHVSRTLKESVQFRSGVTVQVFTASWKSTRGFTFADGIIEEGAFLQVEGSSNPDEEIAAAMRPGLITIPGARLYCISTPYARKGLLFKAWQRSWGKDGDAALVWCASTLAMHPGVDAGEIERAFEDDPAVAMAEYGRDGLVSFRSDVEAYISREAVEAVVVTGCRELPCISGVKYHAFCDPSGGSQDSMTLAVAHADKDGRGILDLVREIRAPFSPESAVAEFAQTLKSFGLTRVVGDRYAGSWPTERFAVHGVTYTASEQSKSEIYVAFVPLLNGRRVALLDVPKLSVQLCGLERRTGRGTGRDSIDHQPGGHDDLCNAACGALVLATGAKRRGKRMIASFGDALGDYTRFDSWEEPRPVVPVQTHSEEDDDFGS